MGNEWKEVELGSLVVFQEGYVNPSQKKEEYFGDEIKWLRATDLNDSFVWDTSRKLSNLGFESAGKSTKLFEPNTIAISKSGTIGRLGILKDYMCGNRAVINIKLRSPDSNLMYVYYFLRQIKPQIELLAEGSVQKNLYCSVLERIFIPLPPLPEQKAIAQILGSLDDKIELNRKQNATLEAMAQALFQSWFVDFDPVIDKALAAGNEIPEPFEARARRRAALGAKRKPLPPEILALFPDKFTETEAMGWVPDGWGVGVLGDLAEIVGGGTPSTKVPEYFSENGIPWLSPKDLSGFGWKHISRGATDISQEGLKNSGAKIMPKGTVLFSSRAPIGYLAIATSEITTNQGFKSLVPKNGIGSSFLYYLLKSQLPNIEAIATGSTFMEVSGSAMKTFPSILPKTSVLQAFENWLVPMTAMQLSLKNETNSLTNLRDTLLPKLISGEIRVGDLEKVD